MKQSQGLSLNNSVLTKQDNELSLYTGVLSTQVVIKNIAKIKRAFPALPEGFYEVFSERIKANGFTDQRLMDAVTHVIDTCVYPTPTIAQFISFDKTVKVFKYTEIIKMIEDGDPNAFDRYKRIEMDGLPEAVWIHVNDIAKYNL